MASPPLLDDPGHAARRAKTRIAVAAVLLTIAIGGLTLLSRQQPVEKPEEPVSQKQESISSGETPIPNEEKAPAQITSKEQEAPLPPPAQPIPPVTEAPVSAPAVPATPPPPPQISVPQPIKNTRPAPAMKSPATASPFPSEPVVSAGPKTEKPLQVPASKTAEPQKSAATTAAPATTAKSGPEPKNFIVQVGVFTDMDNAKVLQSKLAENGIPSHTETKLQLGPFNSKTEAETAREKLKNLGIGAVVIPGR